MALSKAIGLITANYTNRDASALLEERPLAALPFAGRYRLIDFPISNMVNAGLRTVGLVMPGNYRSLIDHVKSGSSYMLDRKNGGLFIMPGGGYGVTRGGFRFLLRDIIQNKIFLLRASEPYVVLSGSNIVCNVDLRQLIDAHAASGAGITVAWRRATDENNNIVGIKLDGDRVKAFENGIKYGDREFIDLFVISRQLLLQIIDWYSSVDYLDLFEAISRDLDRFDVRGFEYTGYAAGIFDEASYFQRSMEMLQPDKYDLLFDNDRTIMTKPLDVPPAKYLEGAKVTSSLVSSGCQVAGTVRGSIISRGVTVGRGASVVNSIVLQSCTIESGAHIENAIIDRNNVVPAQTELRGAPDAVLIKSKAEHRKL